MAFVFVLLGGMLGAMVGGFPAALVGAIAAPFLWIATRKRLETSVPGEKPVAAADVEPAAVSLAGRVQALEREVAALRSQVHRLTQGVAVGDPVDSSPTGEAPISAAMATEPASQSAWFEPASVMSVPIAAPVVGLPDAPAATLASSESLHEPASIEPVVSNSDSGSIEVSSAIDAQKTRATAPESTPETLDLDASPVTSKTRPPIDTGSTPSGPKPAWAAPSPRPPKPPAPPPVPMADRMPSFVSRWIFGGNTIVKVGVLILFLGLAFLLRYAAERVTVPIELRYAGVALVGAFLLGLGWRLRSRADAAGGQGYGLILQGAGIGVFYLTALAAIKLNPLLTPSMAFVFMAMVAVLGAVLAVSQNAPWLALVSVAEGFAAPVLVSTGGGNHIALFSYIAILDVGIFLMAWFRAWRPLNLVGAVSTFALASAWAHAHYDEPLYGSVQFFLLLFFALFTFIGVLFARRALAQGDEPDARRPLSVRAAQALDRVGRVDSTLAFGIPLAAYGLQYLLVRDTAWGPAWSAFGFALFYLLLGGVLLRGGNKRYSLLGEAYVIVSVIFGTLTIPLALEGVWTGATWAVEAAGMYWLGARQRRVYARVFALAVLTAAVIQLVSDLGLDLRHGTPLLTGSVLGMALLCASAFAMDAVSRRIATTDRNAFESANWLVLPALVVASLTAIAWMLLVPMWAGVLTAWLAFACIAIHSRYGLPALQLCAASLYAVALGSLATTLHTVEGSAMLANGWQGLAASVLTGVSLLMSAWIGLRDHLRSTEAQGTPPQWSMASSAGLLAGIGLLSMSLLFVMPADKAALVWPWMGLGALWMGLRIAHPALGFAWFALQLIAGMATVRYGPTLWPSDPAASHSAPALWGPLVLSMVAFISGDMLQRAAKAAQRPSLWTRQALVQWGVVVWALLWWINLLPPELNRQLRLFRAIELWPSLLVIFILFSSMLMVSLSRARRWLVLGQATVITLPAWIFAALIGPAGEGLKPSADMGWMMWPLALAWHLVLLRLQKTWWREQALKPLHVLGFWFFLLLAARECQLAMDGLGGVGSAWSTLGFMLVPAIVLALVSRRGLLSRWPLSEYRDTYLVVACGPVALYLLSWLWMGNTQSGAARPLPYVPVLNPLEIGQGLVLLSLALWASALSDKLRAAIPREPVFAVLGATAFALYTGMVLRACHHWAAVPWDSSALFDSTLTQAALSVAWSIVGVCLMLTGHRRFNRIVWAIGACLLGVVVAKLFLVELADRGGLYRIVSFIVVGVLLLVVGYFAPMPPKQKDAGAKAPAA